MPPLDERDMARHRQAQDIITSTGSRDVSVKLCAKANRMTNHLPARPTSQNTTCNEYFAANKMSIIIEDNLGQ